MCKLIKFLLLSSAFALIFSAAASAQSTNGQFGQNRVQYHQFEWSFYESEHFNTYFYIGGQDLGKFVILDAEKELKDLSEMMDISLRNKIDILVYTDITDANMSNVGLYGGMDDRNVGGTVKVNDSKIFLYFDGNHDHLQAQLREGIVRVYIKRISQGSNFQEVMQNFVMSSLPTWYTDGLAKYLGSGWNYEDDAKFSAEIKAGRFRKFKKLEREDAAFLGKAFWNYIVKQYGKSTINNLVYLTRVNRTVESAFLLSLGKTVNESINACMKYYTAKYAEQAKDKSYPSKDEFLPIKTKKNTDYYQLHVNPDGKSLAYVSNQIGRQKLHIYDLKEKKDKVVLRLGFKTQNLLTDHSYPLIDWEPEGKKLAIIYERKDEIKLMTYDLKSHKKVKNGVTKFQKVFNMSYGSDKNTLLLSAMQKGQCDIFTYQINNTNVNQITNDIWDDLDPKFVSAGDYRGIMWKSNRINDTIRNEKLVKTLPLGLFNLFFYSPVVSNGMYCRVTDNSNAAQYGQGNLGSNYYQFLSNESGITNRYIGRFEEVFWYNAVTYYFTDTINHTSDSLTLNEIQPIDSVMDMSTVVITGTHRFPVNKLIGVNFPVTDNARSMSEQSLCAEKEKVATLYYTGKKYQFCWEAIDTNMTSKRAVHLNMPQDNAMPNGENTDKNNGAKQEEIKERPKEQEPTQHYFQSDFDYLYSNDTGASALPVLELSKPVNTAKAIQGGAYRFSKTQPYLVKMMTDKIAFQLDNSLLLTRYAPFNPGNPVFNTPSFGGLIKMGITDLMEDYRIYGGYKIPTSATGSEYFVTYENLKRRLDTKYTYYRSSVPNSSNDPQVPFSSVLLKPENLPLRYAIKTNYFEAQVRYPLNILNSVRFGLAYRNDKFVYKADNLQSLRLPNYATNWVLFKVEYVFDRTINLATNIKEGTRFRMFTEFHKEIPTKNTDLFGGTFNANLPSWNNSYFGIIGMDVRHYQKLFKHVIWATRLSWATSYGNKKLIYYMGGVDGAVSPSFNRTTPINLNNNYAYQALATDMRGFDYNIRNGNSYALINTEIRFPVFATLINAPIRSEFIRNFQVVGFTDVGTAWEGKNPFAHDNPLFQETIREGNSPIAVNVYQYRSPVVAGYGFGFRTSIFGYFVRTDLAWGYDGNKVTGPKVHFSFNLDF